ncbi:hypothetical protein CPB84DRAFT_1706698 [Gymnopilus junonius]|uniref:F-box domain-containing protein n=1 Tax=Gymnopilus junonius TaxID=109634 RepID=A0A9P5NTJ1_GYMJU|nr:hypothetical protein CPB84DRAFT_1706698 [Gymnopilus junonius]
MKGNEGAQGQQAALSSADDSALQCNNPYEELAVVEAEVETVTATLTGLVRKLHLLKERINDLYSPFVRLLPPEIVSEIFIFCLPVFDSTEESPSSQGTSTPLRIGAVCSAWRRIAWSTPSIWATLVFHLTSSLNIVNQTILLEEWLSRSGQLPLSIRLSSSEEVSWVGISSEGMMKVIAQHAPRWRQVDIRLPSACFRFLPPCDDAENFPLLHSLTLKPPGGQGDRVHKVNIPESPQLRYLSLSCLYLRSVVFHFEVLTHIDLESFYIDEILEVLRQTTSLVRFTTNKVLGGDDRHGIPNEAIILPCLEVIDIHNDKGTELPLLFDKISTPKLRSLTYTGENLQAAPAAEIVELVKRSGCLLQTLNISKAPIREEPLQNLLAALPSLTSLCLIMPILTTLRHAPLTDAVLQTLDPQWASAHKVTCSLPKLRNFTYSGAQGFTWPTMLRVLESRLPPPETKGSSTTTQPLVSTETSPTVSSIRDVFLSLAFMTPEENLAYPSPDMSAFESFRARGATVVTKTTIHAEAVVEPPE